MKKYFTDAVKVAKLFLLALWLSPVSFQADATAWTTVAPGNINNLTSWTNGHGSPVSFTNPGDTWAITDSMTMPASATWTVGSTTSSVTLAAGGSINSSFGGAAPVINIYGNLIGNGGTYNVMGGGATPILNVYGNTIITTGSFNIMGGGAHFTFNQYGNFDMIGGSINVSGGACNNTINFFGNCSLSGTSAFTSVGGLATGSLHFALASTSGVMLIDNSSTGVWAAMDVYVDTGATAQLNGNFTTSTGTVTNGLTVNGRLICPASDSVVGTNDFNLGASGSLIVAHPAGINAAIVTTGVTTFSNMATYGFNGLAAQVTGTYLPTTLYAPDTLIMENSAGVTLSQTTSTTGILLFSGGILHTGINTMTVPGQATSVRGAGAGQYVNGTLIKTISGDTMVNYEIGDTDYAPLTLIFDTAGTAGSIAATITYGLHPSVGSSTLSTSNMVNHYWTITNNSPAGPSKVKVKATYDVADILGGSNAYFTTQQYAGSFWLATPITDTNTSSPYTSTTDSTIPLGALGGDYIFGRVTGALNANIATNVPAGLQIFPNPNTGTFTLYLASAINEEANIAIATLAGQSVKEVTAATNKMTEITLDAAPGIYLLWATTAHGSYSEKIIVR